MLKLIFILLAFIITPSTFAQPKFQLEAYSGVQHVHHHLCNLEDKSYHRGFTMSAGLRFNFNLNDRWSIIPGYTLNNIIGDNYTFPFERILRLDVRYRFRGSPRFPRFRLSAETGLEWAYYDKRIKFPIYLGAQYNLNAYMDLFMRARLPNLLEFDALQLYHFVESSIEIGIAFNPKWDNLPKYTYGGNPYILQ
ncbi:MAG: hypothetical protein ACI8ZM_001531 [Crocinitomix sp.]|jgi:hypothetical protein